MFKSNFKKMEDNLKLWNSVEKTDPKYTKKANLGGKSITSIAPQYQVMNATEKLGIYGEGWGFKNIQLDYTLVATHDLVIFKAVFFFKAEGKTSEFEIINSAKLHIDNARTKVNDNFAKSIETDTLTKALSKLGFNADIFLGKFDDTRYFDEVTTEFANKEVEANKAKVDTEKARLNEIYKQIVKCTDTEQLTALHGALNAQDKATMKLHFTKQKESFNTEIQ